MIFKGTPKMPISPAKAAKNPIAKKSPKQSLTGVYRDRDVLQ